VDKPIIGVPLGDIAGIGPEIVVKALKEESIYRFLTPVVIGSKDAICQALEICGLDSRINVVDETLSKVVSDSSTINLVDTGNIGVAGIKNGTGPGTMWKSGFRLYQANR